MGKVIVSGRSAVAGIVVAAAGCLSAAGPAGGAVFSDDFNRPSSTDLGGQWTQQAGEFYVVGDSYVRSPGNATRALATVNGFDTTEPTLTIDANYPSNNVDVGYLALVGRYADASNSVYVKVQNTTGANAAGFDALFFYYGTDGGAWAGMTGGEAMQTITPFRNGRLTLTVAGSDVMATIDTDFDGTPEMTYTRGGLPLANLGTGVGMGMLTIDVAVDADNFTAVPEPASAAALALAAAGLMAGRRRERR